MTPVGALFSTQTRHRLGGSKLWGRAQFHSRAGNRKRESSGGVSLKLAFFRAHGPPQVAGKRLGFPQLSCQLPIRVTLRPWGPRDDPRQRREHFRESPERSTRDDRGKQPFRGDRCNRIGGQTQRLGPRTLGCQTLRSVPPVARQNRVNRWNRPIRCDWRARRPRPLPISSSSQFVCLSPSSGKGIRHDPAHICSRSIQPAVGSAGDLLRRTDGSRTGSGRELRDLLRGGLWAGPLQSRLLDCPPSEAAKCVRVPQDLPAVPSDGRDSRATGSLGGAGGAFQHRPVRGRGGCRIARRIRNAGLRPVGTDGSGGLGCHPRL